MRCLWGVNKLFLPPRPYLRPNDLYRQVDNESLLMGGKWLRRQSGLAGSALSGRWLEKRCMNAVHLPFTHINEVRGQISLGDTGLKLCPQALLSRVVVGAVFVLSR